MMGWYGWSGMGTYGWIGMIAMLVFWFGLIALVVWAVGRAVGAGRPVVSDGPREDPALRILSERFARGEITEDEYRKAKDVLGGSSR
ncbi:MAG TPA: SHOCT domain-containing protein [Thermomicrobiaceae bacterium]|nr:SHOCT domain-containing protein [Thermomicrobiaceae bacterium]